MPGHADRTSPPRTGLLIGLALVIVALRIAYLLQLPGSPLAIVAPSGLDAGLNHHIAQDLAQGRSPQHLALASAYTFCLALVFRLFGVHVPLVWAMQMLLGLGSCWLVYRIARRLLNPTEAAIALALYGTYGTLLFYEGLLVSTTLGVFLSLLITDRLLRQSAAGFHPSDGMLIGMLLGLLAKTINVAWPLTGVITPWVARRATGRSHALPVAASVLGGVAVAVLALSLPNRLLAQAKNPVPAHTGINLYIGNGPRATGTFQPPPGMRASQVGLFQDSKRMAERALGTPLSEPDANRYWLRETLHVVAANPWRALWLVGRKALLIINRGEPDDVENVEVARRFLPVLRLPLIPFGVLAPLGLLGLLLGWRRPEWSLTRTYLLGYAASMLLVFVTTRHRLPLVPHLALCAAFAVSHIRRLITQRAFGRVASCAGALVSLIGLTHLSLLSLNSANALYNLSVRYASAGELAKARQAAQEAIQLQPGFSDAFFELGTIAYRQEHLEEAGRAFEQAIALNPTNPDTHYNLGFVLEHEGRLEEAIERYEHARMLDPANARILFTLGCAHLALEHASVAKGYFDRAAQLDPLIPPTLERLIPYGGPQSRCD